jgi:raffinose/stachyose/melibiose transport system substrate-binding protein
LLGPSTSEGKLLNIPYQPYAVLFFYNKDHFDKAGLTKVPETWDEFLATNAALKTAGFAPITTDVDSYLDIILGYYVERAKGCDFFMKTLTDKTGELWRDPAYLQMAQDIKGLNDQGYIAKGTDGNLYPAGQQQVALGEVTMYLNGTWLPTEVKDTAGPDFNWGSFSFPTVTGGVNPVTDIMMGSQGIAVTNISAHPDQAFEFIKYLVSKKTQTAMTVQANVPAIHVDVPWAGPIADAGVAVKGSTKAIGWACNLGDAGDVASNVVLPQFQELFDNKVTPEKYIDNMVTKSAAFWAGQK